MMTWCEGDYVPSPAHDKKKHPKVKKKTRCSKAKAFATIDPSQNVRSELKNNKKLSDLGWNGPMTDLIRGAKAASHVVILLYVVGVITLALTMAGTVFTVFQKESGTSFGFMMIRIRSIATAVSLK